jgi:hypothetical protein
MDEKYPLAGMQINFLCFFFTRITAMKKLLLIICTFLVTIPAFAQTKNEKEIFTFTITDYIVNAGDSIKIVQVQLPVSNVVIEMGQVGLLKHNNSNSADDTVKVAWGKCQLIKNNYYYFGLHLYNKNNTPLKNDLLYTRINYPAKYKGRIFNLVRNAVYFEHVAGGNFYSFTDPLALNEQKENSLIDSLVADIKFTGMAMLKQNDGQDQTIDGGIFKGKKLFAAMQTVTSSNVKSFLDYVIAFQQKYAGNTWKISETFATWMVGGAPTVIKRSN